MAKQLGWLPKLNIMAEEIGEEEAEIERLKNPPPLFPPEREITMWAAPSEPWWSKFGRQMKEQYQPAWLSPQERKELGVEWWQNPRLRLDVMFAASEMALPVPLLGNVPTRALRQLAPTSKALKAVTAPAVFAEELPGKALGALGRTLGRGTREAKLAPQRGAIGKIPRGMDVPQWYNENRINLTGQVGNVDLSLPWQRLTAPQKKRVKGLFSKYKTALKASLEAEQAINDARQEIALTKQWTKGDSTLERQAYDQYIETIEREIGNRGLPYHGGAGNAYPEYKTKQLLALRDEYIAARNSLIPKAEAGMPEAGIQTDIFGGETRVLPKGKGRVTQESMEDYAKLQAAKSEFPLEKPIDEMTSRARQEAAKEAAETTAKAKAGMPEVTPVIPEITKPIQEWYHGSKQEINKFALSYEAPGRNVENLFGEGLYITDNPTVAGTYAKTEGTVYKLSLKPDLKLLDLEMPLPQDATEAFINFVKYNDQFLGSIDEQLVTKWIKEGKSGAEIYSRIVDDISDMPKSEAIEAFGGIVQSLQDKGYEGFSHMGGIRAGRGKTLHNVRILWNPEDAITSRSVAPKGAIPKAEVVTPTAPVIEEKMPLPLMAEESVLPAIGRIRLYRAEGKSGISNIPNWIPSEGAWSRWFTDDLDEAKAYLRDFVGLEYGQIVHVDVPIELAERYRISNLGGEAARYSKKPSIEFFLPKDIADKRVLFKAQVAIPKAEAGIAPQAPRPVEAAAKPLTEGLTPPPPPEVPPVAKMLPEEADDLIARFVKIIKSPKAEEAWELTKELRRPIHARRFAAFGDEYRRLVDQGMAVDEAIQKATVHLKGKYPLQSLSLNDSPELRQALFTKLDKVARETNMLEGEVIATAKALEDALKRGNIPRSPGVKGGSAYTRLLKVFDKEVVDILDKPGKLVDILLGPVEQIDREALDALAKLPDIGQQLPMIPVGKRAKVLAALQKAGVNIIESFNLVRSFRSAYDISMPFRQGLVAGVRHPVNWLRAWKPMVKALVNEDFATAFNKSLTADADVAEAVAKDWLDMISLERAAPYMKRLESFASRWAESIPGVRQSQRAAATFVNALMVDNYKAGVNVLRKAGADSSEFKAFAELVNISVGRGSIPKFAQRFAPTLNALLFSPRLLAARLELPTKLASSSPMVRKEAAKTMVSLLGFGALVLGLFKMAGGKPEFDPRGTEVGKVRIGNTRLDFWGGYIQYVRFMGQLLSGKRKTTEGTIQEVDRARLITRFFQSKEAPMLSLFTDLISGETFSGEKVSFTPKGIGKLAYENLAPFGISDFIEAVMEEGELGIIPGILAQTGVGAVTYGGKQRGGEIDLGGLKVPKFEESKLKPSGFEDFDLSKLKIPKFEESKLR